MEHDFEASTLSLSKRQNESRSCHPSQCKPSRSTKFALIAVVVATAIACVILAVSLTITRAQENDNYSQVLLSDSLSRVAKVDEVISFVRQQLVFWATSMSQRGPIMMHEMHKAEFSELADQLLNYNLLKQLRVVSSLVLTSVLETPPQKVEFEDRFNCSLHSTTGATNYDFDTAVPVQYIYPPAPVVCLDIYSEAVFRRRTIDEAARTKSMAATPALQLVQGSLASVFIVSLSTDKSEMRNVSQTFGTLNALVLINNVLKATVDLASRRGVMYEIDSLAGPPSSKRLLFASNDIDISTDNLSSFKCAGVNVSESISWLFCFDVDPGLQAPVEFAPYLGPILLTVLLSWLVVLGVLVSAIWYLGQRRKAEMEKDAFLANVSHELRTPLTTVVLGTELLPDGPAAQAIMESAKALLRMINDLLDLSRFQSGQEIPMQKEIISMSQVTQRAYRLLQLLAKKHNIVLELELDVSFEPMVFGDPDRLIQILINLLSNAIKFSFPHQTVLIRCSCPKLSSVQVQVIDRGKGLSSDQMSRLWRRFARVGDGDATLGSDQYVSRGVGLGLVVSRNITDRHNGDLTLESDGLNCGTTATLTLDMVSKRDLVVADDALPDVESIMKSEVPSRDPSFSSVNSMVAVNSPNGSAVSALVVDDTIVNLRIVGHLLQRMPEISQVFTASSGEEALRILEAQKRDGKIHVVLLDVHMPSMDGPEVARRIRADPARYGDMPIYALTASASQGVQQECLSAGMDRILVKPITSRALKELMEEIIAKSKM